APLPRLLRYLDELAERRLADPEQGQDLADVVGAGSDLTSLQAGDLGRGAPHVLGDLLDREARLLPVAAKFSAESPTAHCRTETAPAGHVGASYQTPRGAFSVLSSRTAGKHPPLDARRSVVPGRRLQVARIRGSRHPVP